MSQTSLELWRRKRERRRARLLAAELRRQPTPPRPGGNSAPVNGQPVAELYRPEYYRFAAMPERSSPAPRPVQKYVPLNTHRAGSIAYSFLYGYWLPNSGQSK